MARALMMEIAISTRLRPKESATEPHAYAPTIMPMKIILFSHPWKKQNAFYRETNVIFCMNLRIL